MRCVTITDKSVQLTDRPEPTPGPHEVLVSVAAAGLNRADILQRDGHYPAPPGVPVDVPGLEFAGTVTALGRGADRFAMGARVMGLVGGGAQAQALVVHERLLMTVPDSVALMPAGGFAEAFLTAYDALAIQAGLVAEERLLVTGAAGGVGTAAIQLARAIGANVVASVRNPVLRSRIEELGVEAIAPADVPRHPTFDVVLELVGGESLERSLVAAARGARIVVIGAGGGVKAHVNLVRLMDRRVCLMGSTIRSRTFDEKAALTCAGEEHVLPLLAAGRVAVLVSEQVPADKVAYAYEAFVSGGKLGKIILDMA